MLRDQIIKVAKTYIGTPYKKLDCSAFVRAVFRKFDYELPRVSASQGKALYNKGLAKKIEKGAKVADVIAKLQVGGLLFWGNPKYDERWMDIHHVAIYAGNGKTIESTPSGDGVHIGNVWETSKWQIVLIADITSLLKYEGEEEMNLKEGDSGKIVERAQRGLFDIGYGGEMDINQIGAYGPKTTKAVNKFRKDNGLSEIGTIDDTVFSLISEKQGAKIAELKKANAELTSKGDATCKIWGR